MCGRTIRIILGAGGWLKVERRLADCRGETLSRLVTDEARGSPGAPETRLQARWRNQGALRADSTSDCVGDA